MTDAFKSLTDMLFLALRLLWPLWLLAAIWISVSVGLKFYKAYRASHSGIVELDTLAGLDFEQYLEDLFRKLGYSVKRTVYQGDYRADLILQRAELQIVVQAQCYNCNVGLKAVQEVIAAKSYYQCQQAMVLTNHFYTKQAKQLAQANEVELWDRNDLIKTLLSLKQHPLKQVESDCAATQPQATFALADTAQVVPPALCEQCGIMVSSQAQSYCLRHQEVFGGKIYCDEHQKDIRQRAKRKAVDRAKLV